MKQFSSLKNIKSHILNDHNEWNVAFNMQGSRRRVSKYSRGIICISSNKYRTLAYHWSQTHHSLEFVSPPLYGGPITERTSVLFSIHVLKWNWISFVTYRDALSNTMHYRRLALKYQWRISVLYSTVPNVSQVFKITIYMYYYSISYKRKCYNIFGLHQTCITIK